MTGFKGTKGNVLQYNHLETSDGTPRVDALREALSEKKQDIEDGKNAQKQLRSEIDNMNKEISRLNKRREKVLQIRPRHTDILTDLVDRRWRKAASTNSWRSRKKSSPKKWQGLRPNQNSG